MGAVERYTDEIQYAPKKYLKGLPCQGNRLTMKRPYLVQQGTIEGTIKYLKDIIRVVHGYEDR